MALTCEECGETCPSAGALRLHLLDHKEAYAAPQPTALAPPPGMPSAGAPLAPPGPPGFPVGQPYAPPRSGLGPLQVVAIVGASILGLVVMLVLAVTVLGSSEDAVADPVPFESAEGRFRAEFPGAPRMHRQSRDGLTITLHQVETDDFAFGVGYADLPVAGADPNLVLDAVPQGSANEVAGTVTSKTLTTALGWPAIDYVITGKKDGHDFEARARALLVKDRLYIVQGFTRPGQHHESYDHLLATFVVLAG